jgi:hypothetical protein
VAAPQSKALTQIRKPMPQMHADETQRHQLSGLVIVCDFTVLTRCGSGAAEKVYENALLYKIQKAGVAVAQQQ